jgi:hypothetical protein
MKNYESEVKCYFEKLGYHVEKITEGELQSPDFLIWDDESTYVLEVKTKFPSSEQVTERERVLELGRIYNICESIKNNNTLSGIVKKANKQLEQYNDEDLLRIVLLLATGHNAELRMLQFKATLYGLAPIVSCQGASDCYFFYNSDFYRHSETIDGAIVSTESEAKLLLNPLSPRFARLKASSLPIHFGGAVVDPIELERHGKAFIVESDVNRADRDAVLSFLRDKYGIADMMNLTMNYLSGTLVVPDLGDVE